jgi:hypothetical protein
MTDFSNSNGGIGFGGLDPGINQILQAQQSQLQQLQKAQQPSAFRRILGTVAGIAGNAFAPGIGGALGNIIGGGGGGGLGGLLGGGGGLGGLLGGANGNIASAGLLGASDAAGAAALAAGANATNAANFAAGSQLLATAQQSNQNEEILELTANLAKAKHETAMAIIQNIGN